MLPYTNDEKAIIDKIKAIITPYTGITPLEIVAEEDFLSNSIQGNGKIFIQRVISFFEIILYTPLEGIDYHKLREISNSLEVIIEKLVEVQKFDHLNENLEDLNDKISQLENSYRNGFHNIMSLLTYQNLHQESLNVFSKKSEEIIFKLEEDQKMIIEKMQRDVDTRINQIDTLQNQITELSKNAAITINASYFKNESDSHEKSASHWQWATIIVGVTIIIYAFWGISVSSENYPGESITPVYITHYLLPRITILFVLIYALSWSAKNYSSHRHNFIVNKHRQNALNTFQVFAQATTGDQDTKNAILLQSTNCIFAPQASGYSSNDPEQDVTTKALGAIKSLK